LSIASVLSLSRSPLLARSLTRYFLLQTYFQIRICFSSNFSIFVSHISSAKLHANPKTNIQFFCILHFGFSHYCSAKSVNLSACFEFIASFSNGNLVVKVST
jgi:hypothetical protein